MLPDVLRSGLKLVVCGSAAGTRSAEVQAYYAGPGNSFWRTLASVGLTPRVLAPAEFRVLLEFGIGLTDLAKGQAGSDNAIAFRRADAERLRATIKQFAPRVLCFNGKRAAREYFGRTALGYGLQDEMIGTTRLFVAPSTSGAARRSWDYSVWEEMARVVDREAE